MGSVANTPAENETVQGATGSTRPNPVAFETPVNVTGARPSSEGARDLFTEEARTILVFVDGAVIQLTSPVSEGQLLFLTNKKSNEEVVCQVLHKRRFGAAACYVELRFTEDKPNYWGVAFPKGKKQSAEFTAAEHVAAERTTEQGAGTPPPARSEKDVDDLKTQVEELRKQLAELEKKNAAETAAKAAAERAAAEEHAAAEAALKEAEEAKASAARARDERGSANHNTADPGATQAGGEALLMPPATMETKSAGLTVKMALPTQSKELGEKSAKEGESEGLPKPELDFSKVPEAASAEEIAARASLKSASPWREKLRVAGFIVILGAVGFGVYEKLAPYVATVTRKTASASSATNVATAPKSAATPKARVSGAVQAPSAMTGATTSATGNNAAAPVKAGAPETAARPEENKEAASGNTAPATRASSGTNDGAPAETKAAEETAANKPVARSRGTKKSLGKGSVAQNVPADVIPADTPVIPAKLLHAAPPVYPPDAMRSYITGDVKAELMVDASGRIGEVKVLSGPSALREAAVEALKKYEYAPATQGGKAVASKTTAVVKFWFNP